MSWYIELFASSNVADPDHVDATKGKKRFNILTIHPQDEVVFESEYTAEGVLDRNRIKRKIYDIEFLPFFIKTSLYDDQQDLSDLEDLKEMLSQPYLVIKDTDLPPFVEASKFKTNNPLPVEVSYRGDINESRNKENGIIEVSISVQDVYVASRTKPTPVTTEDDW